MRQLWGDCLPQRDARTVVIKLDSRNGNRVLSCPISQLPATLFAPELFFRLELGCGASTAWTLHRAHISHRLFQNSNQARVEFMFLDYEAICSFAGGLETVRRGPIDIE